MILRTSPNKIDNPLTLKAIQESGQEDLIKNNLASIPEDRSVALLKFTPIETEICTNSSNDQQYRFVVVSRGKCSIGKLRYGVRAEFFETTLFGRTYYPEEATRDWQEVSSVGKVTLLDQHYYGVTLRYSDQKVEQRFKTKIELLRFLEMMVFHQKTLEDYIKAYDYFRGTTTK